MRPPLTQGCATLALGSGVRPRWGQPLDRLQREPWPRVIWLRISFHCTWRTPAERRDRAGSAGILPCPGPARSPQPSAERRPAVTCWERRRPACSGRSSPTTLGDRAASVGIPPASPIDCLRQSAGETPAVPAYKPRRADDARPHLRFLRNGRAARTRSWNLAAGRRRRPIYAQQPPSAPETRACSSTFWPSPTAL